MEKRIIININDKICSNCEVNEEYCCRTEEEIIDCIITKGKYKEEKLPETYEELKELLKDNNKVEFDDVLVKSKKSIWILNPLGKLFLSFVVDNDHKVEVIDTDKIITIAECYQAIKILIKE